MTLLYCTVTRRSLVLVLVLLDVMAWMWLLAQVPLASYMRR